MKTLESLLDMDFDINMISIKDLVLYMYNNRVRSGSKAEAELIKKIDNTYERETEHGSAQDYWCYMELRAGALLIYWNSERQRGLGAHRTVFVVGRGKFAIEKDTLHWCLDPGWVVPQTEELEELFKQMQKSKQPVQ